MGSNENNIELIRDEVARLLQVHIQGLKQMLEVKDLLTEPSEQQEQQTFDLVSTRERIETLENELSKLRNMDLVIAVVGTMKAGKSTTINAIVGREVLPSRNSAMTALPTCIRHTGGQKEPILRLPNQAQINSWLVMLNKGKPSESKSSEYKETIDYITKGWKFEDSYEGESKIFQCLKILNDLVRVSNVWGVDFPFDAFRSIDQIPVIEVEFAYLSHADKAHGNLTLLDTPGPNEAGQKHLKVMLREQLERASSVLAVLNYSELNSEAAEQVREEIKKIAGVHSGRLFALVNKIDAANRNSKVKDSIESLLAEKLPSEIIDASNVFPVSAEHAYLSRRVLREVNSDEMPDLLIYPWGRDFAVKGMSISPDDDGYYDSDDRDDISDKTRVIKKASKLLKDSKFQEPMEHVIQKSYENAGLLALDSATAKLVSLTSDFENFFGVRNKAFSKNVEDIQQHIDSLSKHRQGISKLEKEAKKNIENLSEDLKCSLQELLNATKLKVEEQLNSFYESGKPSVDQEPKAETVSKLQKGVRKTVKVSVKATKDTLNLTKKALGKKGETGRTTPPEDVFDPSKRKMRFDNKQEAKKKQLEIKKAIELEINVIADDLPSVVENVVNDFGSDAGDVISLSLDLLNVVNDELKADQFDVVLFSFNTGGQPKFENIAKPNTLDAMKKEIRKESYYIVGNGWWAGLKNWMNDDWGREKRTSEVKEWVIDVDEVKGKVEKHIKSMFESYETALTSDVVDPFQQDMNSFFTDLKKKISSVAGDLQQGINDHQLEIEEKKLLVAAIDGMAHRMKIVFQDTKAIGEDVRNLQLATSSLAFKNEKVAM